MQWSILLVVCEQFKQSTGDAGTKLIAMMNLWSVLFFLLAFDAELLKRHEIILTSRCVM